ncbi:MAG: hypothetical protein ACPGUV_11860 [Polyangiales bacterium]
MKVSPWILLACLAVFAVFLLLKSRIALQRGADERKEARRRLGAARQRAMQAEDAAARAEALCEAATIALDELQRPQLAALLARRAARLAPTTSSAWTAICRALEKAGRNRDLEGVLWRRLAALVHDGPKLDSEFAALLERLIHVYAGPLRRAGRAEVLRALAQHLPEAKGEETHNPDRDASAG